MWRILKCVSWFNKFSSWQNMPWQILTDIYCIFNGLKAVRKNSKPKSIWLHFLKVSWRKPNAYGKRCLHCAQLSWGCEHSVPLPTALSLLPLYRWMRFLTTCLFSPYPLLLGGHFLLCPSLVACYLSSLWRRGTYIRHSWGASLSQVRERSPCGQATWPWAGSWVGPSCHLGGARSLPLSAARQLLHLRSWRPWGTRELGDGEPQTT